MKYRHYAPKADMLIVDGPQEAVICHINELVQKNHETGSKAAVIATEETREAYKADVVLCIGARSDEEAIAQHLYRILRACDELAVDVIYSESFQTPRMGQAIMNRLLKAAGHTVLHLSEEDTDS
jgi:L-threonylcarbamoyladenylate synthase